MTIHLYLRLKVSDTEILGARVLNPEAVNGGRT
jgi:hypothetical protein